MNFNQIRQLSPRNGERMILIENGQPTAVLVSFDDYQKMSNPVAEKEEEIIKENTTPEIQNASPEDFPQEKTDLTLEDLPF